ncbi:MAG: endolytic transglycosylase MltG [Candidatus Delongbacteria bacterium]|nr:endolytic transglycosylase MltG [Candidatus Delongbacteria bacterium]
MTKHKRFLLITLFIKLSVLIILPVWTKIRIFEKIVYSGTDSVYFEIPKSSSLEEISCILQRNGFDITEFELKLTAKWFGKDSKIRYGRFVFYPSDNVRLRDFINFLTTNGSLTTNVTIPEGSKTIDIAKILKTNLNIDSISFVERTRDTEILEKYNLPAQSLEGYLYPETYNFNEDEKIDQIIDKMFQMNRMKLSVIRSKIDSSGFSEHQVLTLASIIQGEVMNYDEMEFISAVYNNRLKKGMLLQADPTIQYLFDKPKRLLNKDLAIDNPYNTYIYNGLPPGPINNPSLRAIKAALEPSGEPYTYMVAKGDGNHYFNTNLEGHLEDKAKLDKLRKSVKYRK